MPRLVSAGFLPDNAVIGRRGETRDERRARRRAERARKIAARQDRRDARIEARDRRRAAKREGKKARGAQRRGRRRQTIEDAGRLVDEVTDDDGLLAEYLPPGDPGDGGDEPEEELEELPSTDGFGDDDGWSPSARLGSLRIQARRGQRAATIELRPGLYLVAEIPEKAIAGIGGPVRLAAKVVDAASRALHPKKTVAQIPGPAPAAPVPTAPRRWRDRSAVGCQGASCRCRWEQEG